MKKIVLHFGVTLRRRIADNKLSYILRSEK